MLFVCVCVFFFTFMRSGWSKKISTAVRGLAAATAATTAKVWNSFEVSTPNSLVMLWQVNVFFFRIFSWCICGKNFAIQPDGPICIGRDFGNDPCSTPFKPHDGETCPRYIRRRHLIFSPEITRNIWMQVDPFRGRTLILVVCFIV